MGINLSSVNPISGGVPQSLTIPPGNTTLTGTDLVQTLTNKTIIDTGSNIGANSLKTSSGTLVNVSGSTPTSPGQVLITTSPTNAVWISPPLPTIIFNGTPVSGNFKEYHNNYETSSFISGTVTVYITSNGNSATAGTNPGTPIFQNLDNCHILCTVRQGSNVISVTSCASVRSVNTTTQAIVFGVANVTTLIFGTGMRLYYSVRGY